MCNVTDQVYSLSPQAQPEQKIIKKKNFAVAQKNYNNQAQYNYNNQSKYPYDDSLTNERLERYYAAKKKKKSNNNNNHNDEFGIPAAAYKKAYYAKYFKDESSYMFDAFFVYD